MQREEQKAKRANTPFDFGTEYRKRDNWSFYCNYRCMDPQGGETSISRAVHLRPGGKEPPEPMIRCGGLYYPPGHTDPYNPSRTLPQNPTPSGHDMSSRRSVGLRGLIGYGPAEFDTQAVRDWARRVGCPVPPL